MEGIVIKSTGSWYEVMLQEGSVIKCRLKGKIRLQGLKHTNPVTVGDSVNFEMEPESNNGVIHSINDRKNYIIRKSSNLSKQTHIIASNIDQAMLMVTVAFPTTSLGFMDRFLCTAEAYHIPTVIVFNKTDLCTHGLEEVLEQTIELYTQKVGYRCLKTSVLENKGIEDIKQALKNKTTLIAGHSGVGKSSLLNAIEPNLNLKIGQISQSSFKGQHTTTFAQMHPLTFGGFIIDTPGIREFGVVDLNNAELSHYFKEMQPYIGKCKFNNCQHINEPQCAVLNAIDQGEITAERYQSYLSIMANEDVFN